MSQGKTNVLPPNISGSEPPLSVIWGTFEGKSEHIAGAVYLEMETTRDDFRTVNLALYDSPNGLSGITTGSDPLAFQQQVKARQGHHGDITASGYKLAQDSFKEFLFKKGTRSEIEKALKEQDTKAFDELIDQMLSNIIRKGRKDFTFAGQAVSKKALSRSMGKKPKEEGVDLASDSGQRSEAETDVTYHRVSIVTIPLKGVDPTDLLNGDEIYVRALGSIVKKFPEELHSEKYDEATKPIEARVEGVELNPNLPADFDGQAEDYVEIKVEVPGGIYGRGFVFKEETVRAKNRQNKEESGMDPYMIAGLFFGIGAILTILAIVAYYLFG